MSKWADYGFPQIHGVPLRKLLEGLYLACAERFKILGWYDTYEPIYPYNSADHMLTTKGYEDLFSSGRNIYYVVNIIERMITYPDMDLFPILSSGVSRCTPDLIPISPETLAEALGQDLVTPCSVADRNGGDESQPIWNVTYEWIRQRYEMINICYSAIDPMAQPVYRGQIWRAFDSYSEAEAYEKFYNDPIIEPSYGYGIVVRYESSFDSDNGNEDDFSLRRYISFVEQFPYRIAGPSDLKIYSTPLASLAFWYPFLLDDPEKVKTSAEYIFETDRPGGQNGVGFYRSRYDDMGLGLEINKRQLFEEIALSSDIKKGDIISLSSLCDRIFAAGLKAVPQSGPKNGNSEQIYQDGIDINPTFIYDFKKYLEFC